MLFDDESVVKRSRGTILLRVPAAIGHVLKHGSSEVFSWMLYAGCALELRLTFDLHVFTWLLYLCLPGGPVVVLDSVEAHSSFDKNRNFNSSMDLHFAD